MGGGEFSLWTACGSALPGTGMERPVDPELARSKAAGQQAGKEQKIQTELPKSRARPYGLVIPISTNADGSYISNILSASHQRRSTREVSQSPKQLYFNVTAFGREFHLRLKPNTRLVAPEAVVEWYEDSVETGNGNDAGNTSQTRITTERLWKREPLWTNCAYVGDITDIPGASVAISNCDGLVRLIQWHVCLVFYHFTSRFCCY
uniref:Peptidase M12B propeptide domain-containing protein n=1 Tax=Dromaius novaehollandiae TaxID=8790 RepID=A0A8C4J3Z8_DRONO